jgi:hypothetical protein
MTDDRATVEIVRDEHRRVEIDHAHCVFALARAGAAVIRARASLEQHEADRGD